VGGSVELLLLSETYSTIAVNNPSRFQVSETLERLCQGSQFWQEARLVQAIVEIKLPEGESIVVSDGVTQAHGSDARLTDGQGPCATFRRCTPECTRFNNCGRSSSILFGNQLVSCHHLPILWAVQVFHDLCGMGARSGSTAHRKGIASHTHVLKGRTTIEARSCSSSKRCRYPGQCVTRGPTDPRTNEP
jgi:hypothetical protein